MKTPEQIKAYFEAQPWYPTFVAHTVAYHSSIDTAKILRGDYGYSTLSSAFEWTKTPEGYSEWDRRNRNFRNWFNSEEEPENKIIDLNKFYASFVEDPDKTIEGLKQKALTKISDAVIRGRYKKDDLAGINFSEITKWLSWPDLQDGGLFETVISGACECLKKFYYETSITGLD